MNSVVKLREILEEATSTFEEFQEVLQHTELTGDDANMLLRKAADHYLNARNPKADFRKYLEVLVERGVDINFRIKSSGNSILMMVCEKGNLEMTEAVLAQKGVDLLLTDNRNLNAAFYAIENKNKLNGYSILKLLLTREPSLISYWAGNQNLLSTAIAGSKYDLAKLLIERGADPNFRIPDTGNTALHEALKSVKMRVGQITKEFIRYLLQKGADCQRTNNQQKNAFEFAEKFKDQLTSMLLEVQEEMKTLQICDVQNGKEDQAKVPEQLRAKNESAGKCTQENKQDSKQRKNQVELLRIDGKISKGREFIDKKYASQPKADYEEGTSSESECSQDGSACSDSFLMEEEIYDSLDRQIAQFARDCEEDYHKCVEELTPLLDRLREVAEGEKLRMELSSCFATGMWLQHFDIDVFLTEESPYCDNVFSKLDQVIASLLIDTATCKVKRYNGCRQPRRQVQIVFPSGNLRRLNIVLKDTLSTGLLNSYHSYNQFQVIQFIRTQMLSCPQLQPMFYVLKELTRRYHLLHPREGGIRSYALIIMLLFIMGKYPHQPLGKTLLDFLYYFGYYHTYSFADSSLTGYDKDIMLINVGNPLYKDDNVARYINVYDFQRMCRATYIALHSNIRSNRLGFIFELPQFILQ